MSDCWYYARALGKNGYSLIHVGDKLMYGHRLMYEVYKGEIPKGLEIDHLCRNRSCINPDHLEAVTRRENALRGLGPSLLRMRNLSITHCPQGHEYNNENTYIRPDRDERGCKICRKVAAARFRQRQAA